MRGLYEKVSNILNNVDFGGIWPGFSRFDFALFDNEHVLLGDGDIPWDRRFLGNTSIEYDGGYMAIWHVDRPEAQDSETLAADLVHEMFHAFQKQNGDNRFPDDLTLLNYPDSMENHRFRRMEHLLLASAYEAPEAETKWDLLERFVSVRGYRERFIGDIIRQEYLTETIEGLAEYAGCAALKQISPEKYADRLLKYIDNLRVLDHRFFNIRRTLYFTGAVFAITLADAGVDPRHDIGRASAAFFDIAADKLIKTRLIPDSSDKALFIEADKHIKDKKTRLHEFFKAHDKRTEGDFVICGYDPMNMIRIGDIILCNHFVMLKSGEGEPAFIQGPVALRMKDGSPSEATAYTV